MRRFATLLWIGAVLIGILAGRAGAAAPTSGAGGASFAYVPAEGYPTLPVNAFFVAEHFTYSLLNVETGEDGSQVYAEIAPYVSVGCGAKQHAVLRGMGPALEGLTIVLQAASQSGPRTVAVRFGGADALTNDAILALVHRTYATMSVGLIDTPAGWRVERARILGAKGSKPACA